MVQHGERLPLKLAKDPDDPVWVWFLREYGPHGPSFKWHREYGIRELDILREKISDREGVEPGFSVRLRKVAFEALQTEQTVLIRIAIQVLAVVGEEVDMDEVEQFLDHPDEDVAKDARCCLFERGRKPGGR